MVARGQAELAMSTLASRRPALVVLAVACALVLATTAVGIGLGSAATFPAYAYDGAAGVAKAGERSSSASANDQGFLSDLASEIARRHDYDGSANLARTSARPGGSRWAPQATSFADDGARFVVDSAGSATVRARGPQGWVDLSPHSAQRLTERGISLNAVDDALAMQPFNYFHDGVWKVGYYDSASRVFVGTVSGTATTIIRTGPSYISNLQAATP